MPRSSYCLHPHLREALDGVVTCLDCGARTDWPGLAKVEPPPEPPAKSRPDLIPADALLSIGDVLAWGAARPGLDPDRWKAQGTRGNLAAALRHILAHLSGREIDAETGRPHLAHACARALFALACHERGLR